MDEGKERWVKLGVVIGREVCRLTPPHESGRFEIIHIHVGTSTSRVVTSPRGMGWVMLLNHSRHATRVGSGGCGLGFAMRDHPRNVPFVNFRLDLLGVKVKF